MSEYWREQHESDSREERPDERRDSRQHERVARPSVFCHWVSVECCHECGFVAGYIEQYRAYPSAVHCSVIHGCHQHECGGCVESESECQGYEYCDSVRRTESGHCSDDCPNEASCDGEDECIRRQCDIESYCEILDEFHITLFILRKILVERRVRVRANV